MSEHEHITYRELKRYKYQLLETYELTTELLPPIGADAGIGSSGGWVHLSSLGLLTLKRGYCWNGASKTIDTPSNMRGSLVHDAFYQLFREGLLPQEFRYAADDLFLEICREDGTPRWLVWYYRQGLRFAGFAAERNSGPEIIRRIAP